jgi:hypothetical protein
MMSLNQLIVTPYKLQFVTERSTITGTTHIATWQRISKRSKREVQRRRRPPPSRRRRLPTMTKVQRRVPHLPMTTKSTCKKTVYRVLVGLVLFRRGASGFLSRRGSGQPPLMTTSSNHPTKRSSAELYHRHQFSTTVLAMSFNSTKNEQHPSSTSYSPVSFQVEEQGIIACDMFAIVIACQLMGLVDIVNDPEFSRSGGWLQPIPLIPSTLGILVQRIVLFAFIWIPLSFIRLPTMALMDDASKAKVREQFDDPQPGIRLAIQTAVLFSVARIAMAVAISPMSLSHLDAIDTLRDCYFVTLTTVSFRFVYRQYFG